MNTSVNCSATAGAKYTSLVSFWTQSQLTLTISYLTNEFLQVLQAHEDVLYLAIAGYTVPPALLKPLSVWFPYSPPQYNGCIPQYSCDKLVALQEKFDKLEQFQVFRHPEDVRIKEARIYF